MDVLRASSVYTDDISPPESVQGNSQRSSLEISPIEASSPIDNHSYYVSPLLSSKIPKSKKTSNNSGAGILAAQWRGRGLSLPIRDSSLTTPTRWDDFSGEPTMSEKGEPAQANPGKQKPELESRNKSCSGTSSIDMSNNKDGGQDYGKLSNQRIDHACNPMEGWKGASGRHTIINPLFDKPLPPRKPHSFAAGAQKTSDNHSGSMSAKIIPTSPVAIRNEPNFNQTSCIMENADYVTPLGLINTSLNNISSNATPLRSQKSTFIRSSTPKSLDECAPIDDNSNIGGAAQNLLFASVRAKSVASLEKNEAGHVDNEFRAETHHMDFEDQPPSRFSTTTYATTINDSPPVTPETSHESPKPTPPTLILNRRRPVPPVGWPDLKVTVRKPTPFDVGKTPIDECNEKSYKLLPMSPPEAQAITRVASLQAKLDNLRRRRSNLKTVIHELTNVVQPSSIAYDMASRQEIKKTVDGLNKELLEVVKEEHGTGLQLHRAWKREDETSNFECSSLWVKRLAS